MNIKTRIFSIVLCMSLLFTACTAPTATQPTPESEAQADVSAAATTDTPADTTDEAAQVEIPDKYIDPAIEGNLTEKPSLQDNYIASLGYDWYKNTQLPAGKSRWSRFNELNETVQKDMIALLQSPKESEYQQKAGALFASAMDSETRDAA